MAGHHRRAGARPGTRILDRLTWAVVRRERVAHHAGGVADLLTLVAGHRDRVVPPRARAACSRTQIAAPRRSYGTSSHVGHGSLRHHPGTNGPARHALRALTGWGCRRPRPRSGRDAGSGRVVSGCPSSGAWCRNAGDRARPGPETPKRRLDGRRFGKSLGGDLLSHPASRAVPSALEGLTSGFGMGPGVSPPLWPPKHPGASGCTGNLQNYTASACNRSWLPSPRPISTGQLHTLLCFHFRPINPVV